MNDCPSDVSKVNACVHLEQLLAKENYMGNSFIVYHISIWISGLFCKLPYYQFNLVELHIQVNMS